MHEVFVHPTAEVEDGAEIGAGTRIWRFAHVRAGADVGRDCTIGANVFVDAGVHVGARSKVQNNVSVYAGVTLSDDVFVGPGAVFTNDRVPRAVNPSWHITPTRVGRGASIGANATLVCGHDIGEYAIVAAGAVVTRAVAPHQLVAGNPARHHGWVCWCGSLVSRDAEAPDILDCGDCSGAPNREAER